MLLNLLLASISSSYVNFNFNIFVKISIEFKNTLQQPLPNVKNKVKNKFISPTGVSTADTNDAIVALSLLVTERKTTFLHIYLYQN